MNVWDCLFPIKRIDTLSPVSLSQHYSFVRDDDVEQELDGHDGTLIKMNN